MKKQVLTVIGSIVQVAYPTISKSVAVDCAKLSAEMREEAMYHGIGQKLGDAASGKTPTEKFEMASRIADALLAGNWTIERETDTTEVVVEAVAKIKKIKMADVQAVLDDLEEDAVDAKWKEWRSNGKVKAMIAKIRAERAAKAAEDADDVEL